jgi:hypothetical protein
MLRRLALTLIASLVLAPAALAKAGSVVFDGGTRAEQAQVNAALDASAFDYSIVPTTVTVHIARGLASEATPANVYLDADLLDAGRFAWGVVQHEFAHQVDFLLLTDDERAQLQSLLGGSAWCSGAVHADLSCERFADLVSWAYWSSPDNVMKPASRSDEGGEVPPATFRAALDSILLAAAPVRTVAAVHPSEGTSPKRVREGRPFRRCRRRCGLTTTVAWTPAASPASSPTTTRRSSTASPGS